MKFTLLREKVWSVFGLVTSDGIDVITSYIQECVKDGDNSALQIMAKIDIFSNHGPNYFSSNKFHCIDDDNKIYQITVGRHRIACFFGGEKVVVLAVATLKKTKKAEKAFKQQAADVKAIYETLMGSGNN